MSYLVCLHPDVRRTLACLLAVAFVGSARPSVGGGADVQQPEVQANDPDRAMVFVEKTARATDLFTQHKLPEALAAFAELARDYPDLDEDKYVAIGLADCLYAMGRDEQARAAYKAVADQAVAAGHPELKQVVAVRLRDMDLAGPQISDALIAELRREAGTASGEQRMSGQMQLGRALQKRAAGLLKEAVAMFRIAGEKDGEIANSGQRAMSSQLAMLAEIQEDLASLVDRVEKTWGAVRTLGEIIDHGSPDAGITDYRAEWSTSAADARQVKIMVAWRKGESSPQITVNGRIIKLNSTQVLLLQRHSERINAIIQEALLADQAQAERPK
jgi:tetratricopeptide (TPR) repeat protein